MQDFLDADPDNTCEVDYACIREEAYEAAGLAFDELKQ